MKRLRPESTLVVVIDVQERLAASMPQERMHMVLRAVRILAGAARELHAPVLISEQYPVGLGRTVAELEPQFGPETFRVEKTRFSVAGTVGFDAALESGKIEAVVVLGMETHVCVYQTVRDLALRGIPTLVAVDGVCSRRDDHREVGLSLCEAAGGVLTTAESVVFDWLEDASNAHFKAVARLVR